MKEFATMHYDVHSTQAARFMPILRPLLPDTNAGRPVKQWGDVQKLSMTNILVGGKLPRFPGFDRGPVTIPGCRATVHQGQIYRSAGRTTSFIPSFRIIADMADPCAHTNMAGGPSDRRFAKWYDSGTANWLNGIYKQLRTAQ